MSDNVIQLHTPDRPCDTEESTAPEGYRLQHMAFDNPNVAEPTSSNPFPWIRFHYHNGKGHWRIQQSATEHRDIPISVREAVRMIGDLASFITCKGGSDD